MQIVLQVKIQFKRFIKWMIKPILVQMMDFALRHPSLKGRAMMWLKNYPWIETRLYRLAVNSGRVKVGVLGRPDSHDTANVPGDLAAQESQLPLAAYRIYGDLKAAIAAKQGEGV